MKISLIALLLLGLVGCSKSSAPSEPAAGESAQESAGDEAQDPAAAGGRRMFIECQAEMRGAEACTMDYTPVCGHHADGKEPQTYGNVCGACKDSNVTGYFTGECEGGENL